MKNALQALLNSLEEIGESNEEIYDTACRGAMNEAVFVLFLNPEAGAELPSGFGLYDESANERVNKVLAEYLSKASAQAKEQGLDSFHERLAAFQDAEIASANHQKGHDSFFGWLCPDDFNPDGSRK